jgi:hypothetical protein
MTLVTGTGALATIVALVVAGDLSHLLSAYEARGLLATLLLLLVVIVVREREPTSRRLPHSPAGVTAVPIHVPISRCEHKEENLKIEAKQPTTCWKAAKCCRLRRY